jgi:GWxTD domain-containing protein
VRAAEDPVLTTLTQVKTSYAAKKWDDAELNLRHLLELAEAPERATVRDRILPVYHFYAAVVSWERKNEVRSREHLQRFFSYQPNAALDKGSYSKSFGKVFDTEKMAAAERAPAKPPGPQSIEGGVLPEYATRDLDDTTVPSNTGASDWHETAVRFLLSDDERKRFRGLPDDDARRDFVNRFWERLDPKPDTSQNEYKLEFYRRVQYADANFSTEITKGSLTDRGKVFLILGPPSYVGKAALDQSADMMGYLRTTENVLVPGKNGGVSGAQVVRVETNRSPLTPGDISGEVETWYYRRDRVPAGISFNELRYQFLTQTGYGSAVLQKETVELSALDKAVRLLKAPGVSH